MRSFYWKRRVQAGLAVAVLVFMAGCAAQSDVDFARTVFTRLIKGLYIARPMIDWNHFNVFESDIGAEYRELKDEFKDDYERAFIDGFKRGFQMKPATIKMFTNWRTEAISGVDSEPGLKYVVADIPASNALIVFVVDRTGRQPLLRMMKILVAADEEGAKTEAAQAEK